MVKTISDPAAGHQIDPADALGDFTADRRLLLLTAIAVVLGVISSYLAVGLLRLIAFFTNVFFYQRLSFGAASPFPSGFTATRTRLRWSMTSRGMPSGRSIRLWSSRMSMRPM